MASSYLTELGPSSTSRDINPEWFAQLAESWERQATSLRSACAAASELLTRGDPLAAAEALRSALLPHSVPTPRQAENSSPAATWPLFLAPQDGAL
jgi:hypothetical protein